MGSRFRCCYRRMSNGVVDLSEASAGREPRGRSRGVTAGGEERAETGKSTRRQWDICNRSGAWREPFGMLWARATEKKRKKKN